MVNILIPASVVGEQLYQNKNKNKGQPATEEEVTTNPLGPDGAFEGEAGLEPTDSK